MHEETHTWVTVLLPHLAAFGSTASHFIQDVLRSWSWEQQCTSACRLQVCWACAGSIPTDSDAACIAFICSCAQANSLPAATTTMQQAAAAVAATAAAAAARAPQTADQTVRAATAPPASAATPAAAVAATATPAAVAAAAQAAPGPHQPAGPPWVQT